MINAAYDMIGAGQCKKNAEESHVFPDQAKPVMPKPVRRFKISSVISTFFMYVVLIFLALIIVTPIIYIVFLAFDEAGSLYRPGILPEKFSLSSFYKLFTETDYLKWYGNTIIVGVMNAILTLILVAPTAYAFSRLRFKGRKKYMMIFLVLQMFPGTMAMVAYYVLLNMIGLLNSNFGLVLIFACSAVPGSSFMMKGYYDTISRSVEEAAMLDGANRFQCITRIIVPLALPMFGLICLFAFAAPFGDYMLSRILLSDPDKYTLALGTNSFIMGDMEKDYAMFSTAAILSSLPMTILYLALQKIIMGGLKGAMTR